MRPGGEGKHVVRGAVQVDVARHRLVTERHLHLVDGRVEAPAKVGNYDAIVPSIAGWARQHGVNTITVDDRDPFAHGFQVD